MFEFDLFDKGIDCKLFIVYNIVEDCCFMVGWCGECFNKLFFVVCLFDMVFI